MRDWLKMILIVVFLASCETAEKTTPTTEDTFKLLPAKQTGIFFLNHVEENATNYVAHFNYVYNGGGVAIGDINNDGLPDIYFTGNEVPNKLYLNLGNFKFKDISFTAGVSNQKGWHNGVNMIDVNHDGWLDIYVCRGGWKDENKDRENLLFINNGDLTFTESAVKFGLNDPGYSLHSVFLDIDNDNDLDMYLTNRPGEFYLTMEEVLAGEKEQNDLYRDKLYVNDNGTYKEKGLSAGIVNNFGYGLGVATADINNDGFIDIYVTNDYQQEDYLYVNNGDGTFTNKIKELTNHTSFYSMGLDISDLNNDGYEDILTLDMLPEEYVRSKTTMASMDVASYNDLIDKGFHHQYMHNMLQLNLGNGHFSEISQLAGITKTDWSWSCLGNDFNHDGNKDLYITNGYRRDVTDKDANIKFFKYINSPEIEKNSVAKNTENILNLYQSTKLSNYLFSNNGDLTFSKVTDQWGLAEKSFSNGAATADLDNDGDLDLVVNNLESVAFVYENKTDKKDNNYVKIKLIGPEKNPSGIGAKIEAKCNGQVFFQQFKTTRGYLSSVEPIAHFGLGKNKIIDDLTITWPDGKVSSLQNINTNQTLDIKYAEAENVKAKDEVKSTPILKEVTDLYFDQSFKHQENSFDDYKDQILLPHKLSTLGPFTSIADVNNDGIDDFYVGGAAGQSGTLYIQDNTGKFSVKKNGAFASDSRHEDLGAHFFDSDGDGDPDLYVVSGGNEFPEGSALYQDRLYLNNGRGEFIKSNSLPAITASGSCVISHDFDDDGDLDLFVGGRLVPGKYPMPAQSYLLRNENGSSWTDVSTQYSDQLTKLGMVTDATWLDVNGDQTKELCVVGEWMPITIIKIENKKAVDITADIGFAKTRGWWNTVKSHDIDGDGKQDLILGNLGKNYKFKAEPEKPFYVFADDFDNNGTNDVFLAKKNNNDLVPIRGKECSTQQLPMLKEKFKSYESFANAELGSILGESLHEALSYEAHQFGSMMLRNTGKGFKSIELPTLAQISTIQSFVFGDFDGDNIEDILFGGNNFDVEVETTRADSSPGFVLKGTENGKFESILMPGESGLFIPYNVKDIKKIQLANGNVGVLVTTNNGKMRLLENIKG